MYEMYVCINVCIYVNVSHCMPVSDTHESSCMFVCDYLCICRTGVVYDNLSVMFMHWAFSINNKVGLISFANIY